MPGDADHLQHAANDLLNSGSSARSWRSRRGKATFSPTVMGVKERRAVLEDHGDLAANGLELLLGEAADVFTGDHNAALVGAEEAA